jgi:uracil-DNA glycosylase
MTVLDPPHVLPLMDFVRRLRAQGLSVPSVDPNGGGIFARVLFLQDTPGPEAVGTHVITQDNPDPTARNMTRTLNETGFLRSDVVLWNVVPYCVSTIDQNRNGTPAQIRAAIPYTQAFVDELKSLKVAVYCGLNAQQAQKYLRFPAGVHQLKTNHLAGQSYNHLHLRNDIQAKFKQAYDLAMH